MRQQMGAANLLTTLGLAAGVLAVLLAETRPGIALAAIGMAALLDSVDGVVARRTDACGPFGCHLDSLTDLVAFGVAPALLLVHGPLDGAPVAGALVAVVFVVAGAWRLARFQVAGERACFRGLPIPPAGLAAGGVALLTTSAWVAGTAGTGLAAAMVGAFRVPTFAGVGALLRGAPSPDGGEAPRRRRPTVRMRRRGRARPGLGPHRPPRRRSGRPGARVRRAMSRRSAGRGRSL